MGGAVGTGEGNEVGAGVGAGAGDLDLGALHVELGSTLAAGAVKGEQLHTHQVVTGSDTGGHGEVVPAAVLDHLVDSPDTAVKTIVGNLVAVSVTSFWDEGAWPIFLLLKIIM